MRVQFVRLQLKDLILEMEMHFLSQADKLLASTQAQKCKFMFIIIPWCYFSCCLLACAKKAEKTRNTASLLCRRCCAEDRSGTTAALTQHQQGGCSSSLHADPLDWAPLCTAAAAAAAPARMAQHSNGRQSKALENGEGTMTRLSPPYYLLPAGLAGCN